MTLYHYETYRECDLERLIYVIEASRLATLVSMAAPRFHVSMLPMRVVRDGTTLMLSGHLDRRNPQLSHLDGATVLATFIGPQGYISPRDYVRPQLPTWNYISVHASGSCELFEGDAVVDEIMALMHELESGPDCFRIEREDPRVRQFKSGVCGLRVRVSHVEGRFKLSQDKGPDDRWAAAEALYRRNERDWRPLVSSVLRTLEERSRPPSRPDE